MPKIYVDLDRTLTDFESAVRALGDEAALGLEKNPTDDQRIGMYKAIQRAGTSFWSNMQWMPDGKELLAGLKQYNPVILSSPGHFRDAPAGKQEWVNNNLPGVTLICESDKWQYAERDAILIDDDKNNVGAWEEAGGIGILHTDAPSTLKKLSEVISQKKLAVSDILRRIAQLISL